MTDIGLRERKKTETRRVIAAAALDLALERGPDQITVDDIAAAANVSPRTVFNYFGTKDEAILGIDPDRRADMCAAVVARPGDETPLEALAAVLTDVVTSNADVGRSWRHRSQLAAQYPHLRAAQAVSQEAMEAELARAVATRVGLPDDDLYCHLVAAACLLVSRCALAKAGTQSSSSLRRDLDDGFAVLARGFSPPPARRSR